MKRFLLFLILKVTFLSLLAYGEEGMIQLQLNQAEYFACDEVKREAYFAGQIISVSADAYYNGGGAQLFIDGRLCPVKSLASSIRRLKQVGEVIGQNPDPPTQKNITILNTLDAPNEVKTGHDSDTLNVDIPKSCIRDREHYHGQCVQAVKYILNYLGIACYNDLPVANAHRLAQFLDRNGYDKLTLHSEGQLEPGDVIISSKYRKNYSRTDAKVYTGHDNCLYLNDTCSSRPNAYNRRDPISKVTVMRRGKHSRLVRSESCGYARRDTNSACLRDICEMSVGHCGGSKSRSAQRRREVELPEYLDGFDSAR
jgi:hypothetical protein